MNEKRPLLYVYRVELAHHWDPSYVPLSVPLLAAVSFDEAVKRARTYLYMADPDRGEDAVARCVECLGPLMEAL